MRKPRTRLKAAIYEQGTTQRLISFKTGISESTMSMIVTGKYVPDDQQKRKIARVLRKCENELF